MNVSKMIYGDCVISYEEQTNFNIIEQRRGR